MNNALQSLLTTGLLAASLGAALCCASTPALAQMRTAEWRGTLDQIVEEGIAARAFPGAVLVIGRNDEQIVARGFGHLTYEPDSPPMSMDTIFDLASVSKVVGTATAAMVLLEEGRISLRDRVSKYIAGFDAGGKQDVTLLDLMTHTSGLKAYENRDSVERERREGELPSDALIRRYASLPASYPPRSKVVYSCLNMQTMARVNENASGERQEDLLKRRIYGPLGMSDTGYLLTKRQKPRTAPTLMLKDGSLLQGVVHDPLANYHGSTEHSPGNAGLFSTAADLSRYCRMILKEGELEATRVLRPGTVFRMTSDLAPSGQNTRRGLGWIVYASPAYSTDLNRDNATNAIGHMGYTGTFIWLDKRTKTYIVLLTNRTFPDEKPQARGKPSFFSVRDRIVGAVLDALREEQGTP